MSNPLQNQVNGYTPISGNVADNPGSSFPQEIPQAAPSDFFPPSIPTASSKKFAGGRIIATFLSMLLIVGGLGAGVVLVQNPQLLGQKAAGTENTPIPICIQGLECTPIKISGSTSCISDNGQITFCCPIDYEVSQEDKTCVHK